MFAISSKHVTERVGRASSSNEVPFRNAHWGYAIDDRHTYVMLEPTVLLSLTTLKGLTWKPARQAYYSLCR